MSLGPAPAFHSSSLWAPLPTLPFSSLPTLPFPSSGNLLWGTLHLASSAVQPWRGHDREKRGESKEGCGTGHPAPSLHLGPVVPSRESHVPSLRSCPGWWPWMLTTAHCPGWETSNSMLPTACMGAWNCPLFNLMSYYNSAICSKLGAWRNVSSNSAWI